MADTGWVIATSYNNVAGADTDWVSTTCFVPAAGFSDYLACDTFGFSIPSGATIDGIEVKINQLNQPPTSAIIRDSQIRVYHPSSGLSTDNKASASNWPTTPTDATYGGASDKWGETWSDTDINSSSFGVRIKVGEWSASWTGQAVVGDVQIKVHYTVAPDVSAIIAWALGLSAWFAGQQVASGNASGRSVGTSSRGSSAKHIPIGY